MALTYEDYAVIPYDGRRHEIVDGEHFVLPTPNARHQTVLMRLASALHWYVTTHIEGRIHVAATNVILEEHTVVQPDIVLMSDAREVPDLIAEILSPGNQDYDRRIKYDQYQRAGVPEYWIVDPENDGIEIFRQRAGRFARVDIGDTLTSPLLPGFAVSLRDLFV